MHLKFVTQSAQVSEFNMFRVRDLFRKLVEVHGLLERGFAKSRSFEHGSVGQQTRPIVSPLTRTGRSLPPCIAHRLL